MAHIKTRAPVILIGVIMLGAALRLYHLSAKPLWYDEIGFIAHALKGPALLLHPIANYKLPYILLLKAWIAVFGIGAFAGRSLSVLFGVASLFVTYQLGKRVFNSSVALAASFLLSISCFDIYHSQQVKHYSLLTFLVLVSFLFLIDYFEKKKTGILAANLLSNVLVVCTHPSGFSIIIIQYCYVIFIRRSIGREQLRAWLRFQLPFVLFLGLWAWLLISGESTFKALLWWSTPPTPQTLIDTFSTFTYGGPAFGLDCLGYISFPVLITDALLLLYGFLLVRGLYSIFSKRTGNHGILMVLWLFVPVVLSIIASYLFFPVYFSKNLLLSLPAFYMIVAGATYQKRRLFTLGILTIIVLLNIVPLQKMRSAAINVDWQKAVRVIKSNGLHDNDIIVMAITKEVMPFMYYFSDADKAALRDILTFGKYENGQWQESFQYKDYFIITLGSERPRGGDVYDKPGSGINNLYSSERYIQDDFEKKVMKDEMLRSPRQIWLLISTWAGNTYNSTTMSDRLKTWRELTLFKEAGGIKVYRFSPKAQAVP